MGLPACTGPLGIMPAGAHPATLPEVRAAFVDAAPADQRSARHRVFRALELHIESMLELLPGATIWLDGGFVSHKTWAAPEDADVVYFADLDQLERLSAEELMPLVTTSGVDGALGGSSSGSRMGVPRLQPMGGLVDAFVALRDPVQFSHWGGIWSTVKGADGAVVRGASKGFVEVVF